MLNRLLPCLLMLSLLSPLTAAHASVSIEYMLATINAGGYVSKDDVTVARFRSLLNQLSTTFVEDEQQIGDISVKVQNLLKQDGIQESLINIMEGMNQLFFRKIDNQKYATYTAIYLTMRNKGSSHTEAIRAIQAILRGLGAQ